MEDNAISRRTALITIGGATLAVCLAGCGVSASAPASATGAATTVTKGEIPVGGGKIVGQFVVTQPTAGNFEAFSYLCTHQHLPVQQITTTAIVCGRHGSTFSLTDGSVITGPATSPLAKATISVNGDTLTIS